MNMSSKSMEISSILKLISATVLMIVFSYWSITAWLKYKSEPLATTTQFRLNIECEQSYLHHPLGVYNFSNETLKSFPNPYDWLMISELPSGIPLFLFCPITVFIFHYK